MVPILPTRASPLFGAGLAGVLALGALVSAGCSSGADGDATGGSATTGGEGGQGRPLDAPVDVDLQGREYDLRVPSGYDPSKPAALVVMLHGYTDAAVDMTPWLGMDTYMRTSPEADERGVFLLLAHGSLDKTFGKIFWNATDVCCDLNELAPNDVGYVMAAIEDVKKTYAIDDKRIFALGHSNGGFMAHRLACDQAGTFAGIVSLAGAVFKDAEKCAASAPVAVLQVHGDADTTVLYEGGAPLGIVSLGIAPGAAETVETWAAKNRCGAAKPATTVDLVADIEGPETEKLVYEGCEGNGATELWTLQGAPHSPNFNESWAGAVLDFLMAHPKP